MSSRLQQVQYVKFVTIIRDKKQSKMSKASHKWTPEYPIPPSLVLQEHLEARGYSQAEFARRFGRSPKLISEIIAGKAPLEAKTALQFEKVLGLDADIWIEAQYRVFWLKRQIPENDS